MPLAVALLMGLVGACGPSSRHKAQKRFARKMTPAQVQAARGPAASVRELRVRVYAGHQYRAQTLRWESRLRTRLEKLNSLLGAWFRVRLKLVDAVEWQRESSPDDMEAILSELEILDPGEDVDWVVGLVTGLPQLTVQMSLLGAARPLGKHMFVRGMNDVVERRNFDKLFDTLSGDQREALYQERKRHKELVIFLHEWAHSLGAIHAREPQFVMHDRYDSEMARFADPNAELIRTALKYRGSDAPAAGGMAALYTELGNHLRANRWKGWLGDDYDGALAFLENAVSGSGPIGAETTPEPRARLTPEYRKRYHRAAALAGRGEYVEAWGRVERLTELYDDDPVIMGLACDISARANGHEYRTQVVCDRAAELAPDDLAPLVALARAAASADDPELAFERMRTLHGRLDETGADAPEPWRLLADYYQQRGALTWYEQALDRLPEDEAAERLGWVALERRRYGLPPNAAELGIAPDQEGDYLERVKKVFSHIYAGELDRARSLVRAGRRRYPRGPGFFVVACDIAARSGNHGRARRMCGRALRLYDEASWAHYLAGSLARRRRAYREAARSFERILELDPELQQGWRALAKTYRDLDRSEQLEALRARYRDRFGREL